MLHQIVDREMMLEQWTLEQLLEMDDFDITDALEILEKHGLRLPGFLEVDYDEDDEE